MNKKITKLYVMDCAWSRLNRMGGIVHVWVFYKWRRRACESEMLTKNGN